MGNVLLSLPDEILRLEKRPTKELSQDEKFTILRAEAMGNVLPGELPMDLFVKRMHCLQSPFYLATEVIDKYYKEQFEPIHREAMDDVMGPYIRGEKFKIEGEEYDPKLILGLIVLFSRDTFKSSMAWMMLLYGYLHWKLVQKIDVRGMYVHQVQKKAIKRGGNIRYHARNNDLFRELFPEFKGPPGEWDTKEEWSWPNFEAGSAGESSFTAYGETSDKTGGHYTIRIVDDWETDSLRTTQARVDNYETFQGMEPLEDSTHGVSPYLILGTTYSYDGTHQRLLQDGGYAVWQIPAHKGSPKAVFDLCSLDPRSETGRKGIRDGIKRLEETRSGDLNFPKRLPWDKLYKKARGQGPHVYNTQMLINPVPEGEQRFDIKALESGWVDEIPGPEDMWLYIRCDPAISEKRSADESAYVVGGVSWDGTRWIIDGWIGREKQPTELVKIGYNLAYKWIGRGYSVQSIGFEAVQYQAGLVHISRYGIPERQPAYKGESVPMLTKPCNVVAITRSSNTSKHERLISMDGPISRRELKFWKECKIAEKVMNQFKKYPFDRYDALDATHDLWIKTRTPPRGVSDDLPELHPELLAILRRCGKLQDTDGPVLRGTSNTINLVNW